jgi:hypothetical protein
MRVKDVALFLSLVRPRADLPEWAEGSQVTAFARLMTLQEELQQRCKTARAEFSKVGEVCKLLDGEPLDCTIRIYLDSHGNLNSELTEGDDTGSQGIGPPQFDVCWFNNSHPNGCTGYGEELVSEEEALAAALEERQRFYKEREEVYGKDAWPKQAIRDAERRPT